MKKKVLIVLLIIIVIALVGVYRYATRGKIKNRII